MYDNIPWYRDGLGFSAKVSCRTSSWQPSMEWKSLVCTLWHPSFFGQVIPNSLFTSRGLIATLSRSIFYIFQAVSMAMPSFFGEEQLESSTGWNNAVKIAEKVTHCLQEPGSAAYGECHCRMIHNDSWRYKPLNICRMSWNVKNKCTISLTCYTVMSRNWQSPVFLRMAFMCNMSICETICIAYNTSLFLSLCVVVVVDVVIVGLLTGSPRSQVKRFRAAGNGKGGKGTGCDFNTR